MFNLQQGNKREFTYVSGNPCDPNNPDGEEEDEQNNRSEEQDENVPQNYPKRPVAVQRPRPTQSPTTRAPTTVFQNRYNAPEEEEEPAIQYAPIPKTSPRPAYAQPTQRPRVQVIHTTPVPQPQQQQSFNYASPTPSVNITPKPAYKIQNNVLSLHQTQEPATTYRPHTVSIVTPKPQAIQTTASAYSPSKSVTFGHQSANSNRQQLDFDAEFQKFTQETGFKPITSPPVTQSTKTVKIQPGQSGTTSNPIYQTQLVYNPSNGQYDSALYQTIPQTDGDFTLNQRHQPYVQQYQIPQNAPVPQAVYRPQPVQQHQQVQHQQAAQRPQPQIPQQVYQKQQNELQFVNSQQLFAQQLQMQQTQLQRDRVEAAKKHQSHRFQLQNAEPSPIIRGQQGGQQYYYLQPSAQAQQGSGQIDAFLRGHNLEY